MHSSIEYFLAGLTVLLILIVATVNMFNVMAHTLTGVEQRLGLEKAEEILDMLLLSPGYPPNWGENSQEPEIFGLAVQNAFEKYVLDPKKINRIINGSDYYILPTRARTLLGLSSSDHFHLRIVPFFTVNITNNGDGNYTLRVLNYKGFPVPNANLTCYYLPIPYTQGMQYYSTSTITDKNGYCTVDFPYQENHTLLIYVSQLGIKSIASEQEGLMLKVESGHIINSDMPIFSSLDYSTASVPSWKRETVSLYVKIDDCTYYLQFTYWS